MKKNIFSLIAIAVIGTSTCMAKATPKSVYNPKPRMERKVDRPTTTMVTTTTMKPNGTKVVTTTTTKTVKVAHPKPKMVKPHKPAGHMHHKHHMDHKHHMHHKHHRGTCKACKKHVRHCPKKQLQRSIYSSSPHQVKTLAYGGEIFSAKT